MNDLEINFISVNDSNISEVAKLHVSSKQKGMIETVQACYDEAQNIALWRPIALVVNKEMVGFAMYGQWLNEGIKGRVWLDRFLIDETFQNHGFAKMILPKLIMHIYHEYDFNEIYLSVYEENTVAIHLYESLGFKFNSERDINGELVMVLEISNN